MSLSRIVSKQIREDPTALHFDHPSLYTVTASSAMVAKEEAEGGGGDGGASVACQKGPRVIC